jgi:hypothetical protein
MGILCDQLVIGQGASALSFLYYAREQNNQDLVGDNALTYVIGADDLWAKISEPSTHEFGQPPQIVSKPGVVAPTVANPKFQTAKDVSTQLSEMKDDLIKRGIRFRTGKVTKVLRAGGRFQVFAELPQKSNPKPKLEEFNPKQVIVASGFGPSARIDAIPADLYNTYSNNIFGGTEYLCTELNVPTHSDFTVAVMGASATSSWAVARAFALGAKKILWISRSGFKDANPAGRNSEILKVAKEKGWLVVGKVKSVTANGARLRLVLDRLEDKTEPTKTTNTIKPSELGQHYKDWYDNNKHSAAAKLHAKLDLAPKVLTIEKEMPPFDIDHFVYALGSDSALPGGAKDLLGTIVGELEPVFDDDKRFGDVPSDTTVAFKTPKGDVWVVGAAVFRMVKLADLKDDPDVGLKFSNIAKMMCEAGSPPEGIAAIFASMKAVTGYVATGNKLNMQNIDFKEAETWISNLYRTWNSENKAIPEKTKRVMADQIVAMRKHSVFGLTPEEVAALTDLSIVTTQKFWGYMFGQGANPNKRVIDELAEFA